MYVCESPVNQFVESAPFPKILSLKYFLYINSKIKPLINFSRFLNVMFV